MVAGGWARETEALGNLTNSSEVVLFRERVFLFFFNEFPLKRMRIFYSRHFSIIRILLFVKNAFNVSPLLYNEVERP